jgi:hypothetical protein
VIKCKPCNEKRNKSGAVLTLIIVRHLSTFGPGSRSGFPPCMLVLCLPSISNSSSLPLAYDFFYITCHLHPPIGVLFPTSGFGRIQGRNDFFRDMSKFLRLDSGEFCSVCELIWYFIQRVLPAARGPSGCKYVCFKVHLNSYIQQSVSSLFHHGIGLGGYIYVSYCCFTVCILRQILRVFPHEMHAVYALAKSFCTVTFCVRIPQHRHC